MGTDAIPNPPMDSPHPTHSDRGSQPDAPQAGARWRLHINGVVQGVGFRPHVHRLAHTLGLEGWVRNNAMGVELELQGTPAALETFVNELQQHPPPLAIILEMNVTPVKVLPTTSATAGLTILPSDRQEGPQRTLIAPDVAVCAACLQEMHTPADRRYRYPFINCTHCGPRFTIIHDLPYDRPLTTMADFALCPACHAEYDDPADRRFHAQPVACPQCGPHLTLMTPAQPPLLGEAALQAAVAALNAGGVLALKGLGGFHLAGRADHPAAVANLRRLKDRPHQALALMTADLAAAARLGQLSPPEADLLTSKEAPIVLLRRANGPAWLEAIAPDNGYVGVMLPYTPLHHLLLAAVDAPLIMTSGNRRGAPLIIDNDAALAELGPDTAGVLLHNRPIRQRCDDTVLFVAQPAGRPQTQFIRRSRGYAPLPLLLPPALRLPVDLVAAGADLKNVAAAAADRLVFLTQHIGDLSHPATRAEQAQALAELERLFHIQPQAVVCDYHPDYASRRYAENRAQAEGLLLIEVQHHHAHIAACAVEHGRTEPVIGLSFDGVGYGLDGHIWGGEVLLADLAGFERLFHLEFLPLPGGDAATRRPYRIALAYLHTLLPALARPALFPNIAPAEFNQLRLMLDRRLNTPLTSSLGRLFDAVSALVGFTRSITYEAQAAIALEALALNAPPDDGVYPIPLEEGIFRLGPLLAGVVADRQAGVPAGVIARRFHNSLAQMAVEAVRAARQHPATQRVAATPLPVALGGGVWQNRLLLTLAVARLEADGCTVLLPRQAPANDGGLALGQIAVAAARLAMGDV